VLEASGASRGNASEESHPEFLKIVLVACLIACMLSLAVGYHIWHSEPSYLCKGCSDEAYREIVTRCHVVREFTIRAGENFSFKPNDYEFFNVSCVPSNWELVWVNITSDKPVKVTIHSRTFEGVNITYGCINMGVVTITALQDSRVIVEVRGITPCIYGKPYADFYRLHEALPNLHDDQECP